MNTCVVDVPIKNLALIDLLNDYLYLVNDINIDEYYQLDGSLEDRDQKTSIEYLQWQMDVGNKHQGNGKGCAYPVKSNHIKKSAVNSAYYVEKINKLNDKMSTEIAANRSVLSVVYPPGGFINWHNNANAPGYGFIFTWSETGDGYWQHVDPITKDIITIPDVPGWQCKSVYYGSYDTPDKIVYHTASTNCWRMTQSFLLNNSDESLTLVEQIKDDISNN